VIERFELVAHPTRTGPEGLRSGRGPQANSGGMGIG
jgi:hypothetical protein